jgi:hypothetical protein
MNTKKLLLGIVTLLLSVQTALAANTTLTGVNPFKFATCPSDIFGFFMYFGMGVFMLAILYFCKKIIRVPFITIIIAIGWIIWSTMGLMGCSRIFGLIGIIFGVGIVAYEFISTVGGK